MMTALTSLSNLSNLCHLSVCWLPFLIWDFSGSWYDARFFILTWTSWVLLWSQILFKPSVLAVGGGAIATFMPQVKVHIPHFAVGWGCLLDRGRISGSPLDLGRYLSMRGGRAPWYSSFLAWIPLTPIWRWYLLPLDWDRAFHLRLF